MTGEELLNCALEAQAKPQGPKLRFKQYRKHWPAVRDAWASLRTRRVVSKRQVVRVLIQRHPEDFPAKPGQTEEQRLDRVYRTFLSFESKTANAE